MIVAFALAAALAAPPKPKLPDIFVLTAGEQIYRSGQGARTRQALAIYEPGALAVRLRPGVELRPYVALRVAKDQSSSGELGVSLVIVRQR